MKQLSQSAMIKISFLLVSVVLGLSGCATQPRRVAVEPGKLFVGNYINIRAPQSNGWQQDKSTDAGMVFGKRSDERTDSFVASVNVFNLPPTSTPQEFESLIQKSAANDINSNRFELKQQTIKYSSERNYPCVRYQAVAIDKTPKGSTTPLLLELDGLYCRHPAQQNTGFAAIYSYRGNKRHTTLRSEAEQFIQGVQVPTK